VLGPESRIVPITYVNSTAAIKAFVGANGGACCTSSNADLVFDWAMSQGDVRILFLPDQHLGRNTASKFGIDVARHAALYDPKLARQGEPLGGMTPDQLVDARVILWAGHCSVHKLFRPEHCDAIREQSPRTKIIVHPECCKEVVDKADLAGSTEFIIRTIEEAPAGSRWAVGTEVHLVHRLANEAADRGVDVRILSDCQCLCTTMYRIDQAHLLWILDGLAEGQVRNRIQVHPEVRGPALEALDRMLALQPSSV
ncbi:MAG: quinolinate synthase NadA, partial [Phycisphaerales bacterium]|nr:quinolinate synthase NadA [Phycisphaerales bacterium]